MKDLYTFDMNKHHALATYDQVRAAYGALFDELKVPYLVAEADSGDMGGNLSHEFQFVTNKGEDMVIGCTTCDYVANEEMAQTIPPPANGHSGQWAYVQPGQAVGASSLSTGTTISVWRGVTSDRTTLVNVWFPVEPQFPDQGQGHTWPEINTHAVKAVVPGLDPGVENAEMLWGQTSAGNPETTEEAPRPRKIVNLVDCRVPAAVRDAILSNDPELPYLSASFAELLPNVSTSTIVQKPSNNEPLNLLRIRDGDVCPKCREGALRVQSAIELGHTFHLGDRYSSPLQANVALPADQGLNGPSKGEKVPIQMGCHGIGVSRLIGAVAEILADSKGLNWPRVIAPYEVVVVPAQGNESDAATVYDALMDDARGITTEPVDTVLDDREHPFPWKMRDADLIGYPVIVVVGRHWKQKRVCEVQCRRLAIKEDVQLDELSGFVRKLLSQL
jgi:prolyl-tRNA synthetase